MKTLRIIAIAVLLLNGAGAAALAAGMGTSAGHDLDALWASAQKMYDTAQEDAIILLDSRTTTVGDEGTVVTRVHQVVWIATSRGIRDYADLRVPWNSATSTLEVEKLRTWMDGRWWPDAEKISDTAVVETLPYAVALADDYTTLRETMLLRDGVELPCIMETAYTIAVQGPPTAGADDVFVFPGRDPVVRSECLVRVPVGVDVKWEALNGAPEPVVTENGVTELAWTMDRAGALKLPVTKQPEAYEPTVIWTTWESWEALLREFGEAVEAAAVLDGALADSVAVLTAGLPDGVERVKAVIDFAERTVRPVHTDHQPWRLAPRSAQRTYETGYGHALDRAVYLVALLNRLETVYWPGPQVALARAGRARVAGDLPRFADLASVLVAPDPGPASLLYDVDREQLRDPDGLDVVRVQYPADSTRDTDVRSLGRCSIDISLQPGPDEWTGSGTLLVSGPFRDEARWQASDKSVAATVESMISGMLADLTILDVQSAAGSDHLAVRFTVGIPAPEEAEDGTCRVVVGAPGAGILARLPHHIQAGVADRESPLMLDVGGVQEVTLRFKLGDASVAWSPPASSMRNSAGTFAVTVNEDRGWLTYGRTLQVFGATGTWPDLRALLLEEMDPANGAIVLGKAR